MPGQWRGSDTATAASSFIRAHPPPRTAFFEVSESVRHLSVHRGHNLDVSNRHDVLVDVSAAKQVTFTGTREELRERLAQLEASGATGIIFGTSGYDVERELRAYAQVAGLR